MNRSPAPTLVLSVCLLLLLAGCGGGGSPTPASALPVANDVVEFVALVEGTRIHRRDMFIQLPSNEYGRNAYDETLEARFYRLAEPTSASELLARSGVNTRGCRGVEDATDERPWAVYDQLPESGLMSVSAGEVITVSSEDGNSYKQGSDSVWTRDLLFCVTCSSAPSRYFYSTASAYYSGVPSNAPPTVLGETQKMIRFEQPSAEYVTAITPAISVCRSDDIQPMIFPVETQDNHSYLWTRSALIGTHDEVRANVLLLTSFASVGTERAQPPSGP